MATTLLADRARLTKVVARMDAGDDGAIPAFTLLSHALADAGQNWSDIFAAWLAHRDSQSRQHQPAGPRSTATARRPFPDDDIADWLRGVDAMMARSGQSSRAQKILQGASIPTSLPGVIEITDRRTTRRGTPMLIIAIENSAVLASPIAVFDEVLVADIENGTVLTGLATIRPAAAPHLYPVLTGFADARQTAAAA